MAFASIDAARRSAGVGLCFAGWLLTVTLFFAFMTASTASLPF